MTGESLGHNVTHSYVTDPKLVMIIEAAIIEMLSVRTSEKNRYLLNYIKLKETCSALLAD